MPELFLFKKLINCSLLKWVYTVIQKNVAHAPSLFVRINNFIITSMSRIITVFFNFFKQLALGKPESLLSW